MCICICIRGAEARRTRRSQGHATRRPCQRQRRPWPAAPRAPSQPPRTCAGPRLGSGPVSLRLPSRCGLKWGCEVRVRTKARVLVGVSRPLRDAMGCEGCKGCKGVWLEGLPALQLLAEPPPLRQELLHLNLVNLGQRGRSLGAEGLQSGHLWAAASECLLRLAGISMCRRLWLSVRGLGDLASVALLPSVWMARRQRRHRCVLLRRRVSHQPQRPPAAAAAGIIAAAAFAPAFAPTAAARRACVALCGGGGARLIAPYEPAPPTGGARRLCFPFRAWPLARRAP